MHGGILAAKWAIHGSHNGQGGPSMATKLVRRTSCGGGATTPVPNPMSGESPNKHERKRS